MTSGSPPRLSSTEDLKNRALEGGGFPMFPGGEYRPDATAWAVMLLAATGSDIRDLDLIESGRSRLARSQLDDGRVSISASDSISFWPTPLAILAWHGSEKHAKSRSRAIDFLLRTSGKPFAKEDGSPWEHDTTIRGWSWTEDTFSWVEPTSLSVLALRISGQGEHDRVREGIRMLMDRQLPAGGWNYGNTVTYGKEMYPQPDCTGLALSALSGYVSRTEVEKSVKYLRSRVMRIRTPLSLGWGILGLAAWGRRPEEAEHWLRVCMSRQGKSGLYDTTLVSLLLLASIARNGLGSLFGERRRETNA